MLFVQTAPLYCNRTPTYVSKLLNTNDDISKSMRTGVTNVPRTGSALYFGGSIIDSLTRQMHALSVSRNDSRPPPNSANSVNKGKERKGRVFI